MYPSDSLFDVPWSIDKETSIFSALWRPDAEIRFYEPIGHNGYRLTVSGEHNGKHYRWGYTTFYDGHDHPVLGRDDVDAIETYRVNDKISVGFFKKDGILCGPDSRKLSLDGKSLTIQTIRRNNGNVYFDVIEYKVLCKKEHATPLTLLREEMSRSVGLPLADRSCRGK